MKSNTIKFIDLFAGLGGIRLGFEKAFKNAGMETECVMTSEIKPYAVKTLNTILGTNFWPAIFLKSEMNLFPILIFYWVVFPVSLLVQVENVKAFWTQEELCFLKSNAF